VKNKKILVATATYNEKNNISSLIKKILNLEVRLDILFVDDHSPDGTESMIKEYANKHNNIFLISRNKKKGLDSAHKEIYKFALKNKYDYLITMDADLSHDPSVIPFFLKEIKKYNCVIGSRYMHGGRNDLTGLRLFISKYGNVILKFFLGMKINEFTTSYRCFDLKKLKKFKFSHVKSSGYSFFMSSIYLINLLGYSIKEIPIRFYQRQSGVSKIPKIEIFRVIYNIFLIRLNLLK
jgi:dolichol-phosphate mannosyltransferase